MQYIVIVIVKLWDATLYTIKWSSTTTLHWGFDQIRRPRHTFQIALVHQKSLKHRVRGCVSELSREIAFLHGILLFPHATFILPISLLYSPPSLSLLFLKLLFLLFFFFPFISPLFLLFLPFFFFFFFLFCFLHRFLSPPPSPPLSSASYFVTAPKVCHYLMLTLLVWRWL